MQNSDHNLLKLGMAEDREYEALQAYFSFLHAKGASAESLLQREEALTNLDDYITVIANDGASYRDAVENYLAEIDKSEWPFYLLVIREYFHFWVKDIKKIAQLNAYKNFEPEQRCIEAITGSIEIVGSTLDRNLDDIEQSLIYSYGDMLKNINLSQTIILIKVKLAKLLTIKISEVEGRNSNVYRYAVDATLAGLNAKNQREQFLDVAREFYYLWLVNV